MAVPRNRMSNRRKNIRRAHHAKKARPTTTCTNCQSERMPHTVCQECGFYGKRQVLVKDVD